MSHEPVKDSEDNFHDGHNATKEESKEVSHAVMHAVEVVQAKNLDELRAVWRNLISLPRETVIEELFRLVEDYSYKADDSRIKFSSLSLPENSAAIIDAAIKRDTVALQAALGSTKLSDLFASLLIIIVVLKEASPVSDMDPA